MAEQRQILDKLVLRDANKPHSREGAQRAAMLKVRDYATFAMKQATSKGTVRRLRSARFKPPRGWLRGRGSYQAVGGPCHDPTIVNYVKGVMSPQCGVTPEQQATPSRHHEKT